MRGDVGQTVLAIADGKIDSPLSSWTVGGQAEGLEVGPLRYLHMRVGRDPRGVAFDERWQQLFDAEGKLERIRLRRGTRIHAGDRLGSINSQAHVHLSVGSSGFQRNAALLGFNGFVDSVAPRITDVALLDDADQPLRADAQGRVPVSRGGRGVQIVVEAWDQVDGNLPRRRLGLYQVGYQIRDAAGQPLAGYEQPRWNIVFNRMPPQKEAVRVAYAPDSGITVHGSAVTRFRYLATNTVRDGLMETGRWQPAALPPGEYIVRASVRDYSGNEGVGPREIGLERLFARLDEADPQTPLRELILATNFTAEGETTAHVIAQALKQRGVTVTRLARGVPVGSELEYVDLGTIAHALVDRR